MDSQGLVKFIINIFCQYYKYNIEEFESKNSKLSFWGLSKVTEEKKEYIVFLDESNFYNVGENLLKLDEMVEKVEIRKVLIINKKYREESKWHLLAESYNGEIVVIDELAGRVVYHTPLSELLARQLEGALRYKQEVNKEKQNKQNTEIGIITTMLIIANIIMYILTAFLSGSIFNADVYALIALGAKQNTLILQGEYYRFITAMFLHGGIIHLGFNMYALKAIGPTIEKAFGKIKYLLIYFLGGAISVIASFVFSEEVSIGASGAIFALLGSTLILALRMKDKLGKEMVRNILSVIAINIFIGFSMPNIDNFAHIGGLVGGIAVTSLLKNNDSF